MKYFHGSRICRSYFEGWYLKQQGEDGTVAIIPAWHSDRSGCKYGSLQLVTEDGSWYIKMPASRFLADKNQLRIRLGSSLITGYGCRLHYDGMAEHDGKKVKVSLRGRLYFGRFVPLKYNIMGPFSKVPWMECSHNVFSLCHTVDGYITINDRKYRFHRGNGYIEGDRGRSFPEAYLWSQCSWEGNCIMVSAAEIPLGPAKFRGCIAVLYYRGREYRLATYCGAKVETVSPDGICIRQGQFLLKVSRIHPPVGQGLGKKGAVLKAPQQGDMVRAVYENPSCRVSYRLEKNGCLLWEHTDDEAGFEKSGW